MRRVLCPSLCIFTPVDKALLTVRLKPDTTGNDDDKKRAAIFFDRHPHRDPERVALLDQSG